MKSRRDLRTEFSKDAADFADKFKLIFDNIRIPPHDYAPELTTPSGPSTAGGVQALQHVRLVPKGGGTSILIGSVNRKEGMAELRAFDHIEAIHKLRFKRGVDLDREQYSSFVLKGKRFFEASGLKASLAPLPGKIVLDDDEGGDAGDAKGGRTIALVVVALLLVLAAVAWVFLAK